MPSFSEIARWSLRSGKRVAVTVVGFALILSAPLAIFVPLLPGPLLAIAGLAVLATEYVWACRALEDAKRRTRKLRDKVRRRKDGIRDEIAKSGAGEGDGRPSDERLPG